MKILGLIPARGGSKGIPRKNIREIAGKPLIAWTIEAAKASRALADVIVTTEDAEIAEVAERAGARIPFLRPAELATDETPGIDPVLHAIDALPGYDAVMLLQPTSPLRSAEDIAGMAALAEETGANTIVSVCEAPAHPAWMYRLEDGRLAPLQIDAAPARRQDLTTLYVPNGALYFARTGWLRDTHSFVSEETLGYVMPDERSIDIDVPLDWKFAEFLLGQRAAPT